MEENAMKGSPKDNILSGITVLSSFNTFSPKKSHFENKTTKATIPKKALYIKHLFKINDTEVSLCTA